MEIVLSGRGHSPSSATWGQEYIWRALEPHRPNEGWTNIYAAVDVVAREQRSPNACSNTLAEVLSAYETFRTHFEITESNSVHQLVQQSVSVPVMSFPTGEIPPGFHPSTFDVTSPPLLRVGFETEGGEVVRVHLVWSHLLLDAYSTELVCEQLTAALSGLDRSPGAVVQPVECSAWEVSEDGLAYNRRSLEHWRSQLPHFPARYVGIGAGEEAGFFLGRLEAPGMVAAATRAAAAARVSAPTVLIAAVAETLCRLTGMRQLPFLLRTSGRARKQAHTVGPMAEDAPALYSPASDHSGVRESLSTMFRQLLRAQEYGAYNPADLASMLTSLAEEGFVPDRRVLINCQQGGAKELAAAAANEFQFEWIGEREFDPSVCYVDIFPADGSFLFMLDSTFISRKRFEEAVPMLVGLPDKWRHDS